ncbi:MAG: type II secretion system protein [Sedimentisphaerales bacterium]|nr:type II secretion system protein [Sedimentisphaerales bacterium]
MAVQKNKQYGFTIAELLISLAVMALLLTAVAVAFNASAINFNENSDMFNAMNTGRQAMMRMTSELRTAEEVSAGTLTGQCSFRPAGSTQWKQFWLDGAVIKFCNLDGSGNRITSPSPPILCNNVTSMTFTRAATGTVKSVQMSMTITVNGNSQVIATGVVLRKAL